jgi:PAS domain S-box-containing protein
MQPEHLNSNLLGLGLGRALQPNGNCWVWHLRAGCTPNQGRGIATRKIITSGLTSIYIDVHRLRPGTVGAYALALLTVAVATALQVAVDPYVGGARYITFLLAVTVTALIGGFGAGLLCLALSVAAVDFFLLQPRFSFYVDLINMPALVLFILTGLSSVILTTAIRFVIERNHLQASKAHLQLALDAARLGWWRYDLLGRVASGDTRFKEIFNVTVDEMPIEDIKKLVHPDDAERFWADREASLDPADPQRFAYEYRLQQPDGAIRWVEVRRLVHFEGAGLERRAASVVGTVQDVTERKQREEQEHLLMQEVNHRSKNMLTVVDAIAHQTATKSPEDFVGRFSERIQALSANQDLLIRNEWQGAAIEDLVRAQLAPFAGLIGSRIAVHGPKLRFKAASAQAIGLALHELATNAGKYGALSVDAGRVDVCWHVDGEAFAMTWSECNGPPVSAPKRRGFGTIVIKTMAQRSVDGTVDLDYAPSGVTWRLTCPAANALESRWAS